MNREIVMAYRRGATLPDTDNLGAVLASADWKGGPISFTLIQATQVTMGFVGNLGQNSGEYFRVNKVQLYTE